MVSTWPTLPLGPELVPRRPENGRPGGQRNEKIGDAALVAASINPR